MDVGKTRLLTEKQFPFLVNNYQVILPPSCKSSIPHNFFAVFIFYNLQYIAWYMHAFHTNV